MKKILNLVLICSVLTISSASVLAKDKAEQANVNIAKKPEEIHIVKPEKKKKVNKREERRKNAENAKSKKNSR